MRKNYVQYYAQHVFIVIFALFAFIYQLVFNPNSNI